jgi:threonine dehydrogenase-like Zn-dependent dehydrogenase
MKALVWHGKEDIRCDTVSDPEIEHPRDAIIKVTSCAICGSDLHLFHNFIPAMLPGDIMGHEMMGEVVEVGSGVNGHLKKGDRIVVPFTIICGECDQCKRGNFSVCETTNRSKKLADKVFGHPTAGLFGYTHLTGGYPGGQAEYLRVPFADATQIKVPDSLTDEQVLFLGDIFPTGWQAAVQCDIEPTDTVAIWGCGPVGQMAIRSAILLGAKQVVAIDCIPERLSMAEAGGAITINFMEESVVERLDELTHGKGPEKCIDCVGLESHVSMAQPDTLMDRAKQMMMMENDRPHVLREMIYVCRPAGVISIPGVYSGLVDKIPMGQAMNKGLTFRMGQTHVNRWTDDLVRRIEEGQIDPSFVMYKVFRNKQDSCIKVVLKP